MSDNQYKWIYSEGGPLIGIEQQQKDKWLGCFSLSEYSKDRNLIFEEDFLNSSKTHYAQACAVDESIALEIGIIEIDKIPVLVFADEPDNTTFIQINNKETGIFCRWRYADNDRQLILENMDKLDWKEEKLVFTLQTNNLFLFDAAQTWNQAQKTNNFLQINFNKGTYKIITAEYRPDSRTFFLLHKIEKI